MFISQKVWDQILMRWRGKYFLFRGSCSACTIGPCWLSVLGEIELPLVQRAGQDCSRGLRGAVGRPFGHTGHSCFPWPYMSTIITTVSSSLRSIAPPISSSDLTSENLHVPVPLVQDCCLMLLPNSFLFLFFIFFASVVFHLFHSTQT